MTSGQNDGFKFVNTGTIDRYRSLWDIKPTHYIKNSYVRPYISDDDFKEIYPKRYAQANSMKIIVGGMSKFLECFLDEYGKYIAGKSTTIILGENLDSLKVLLGILNSKLVSSLYSHIFKSLSLAGGFFSIGAPQIKLLPINFPHGQQAKDLIIMVNKILMLNERLNEIAKDSNEWEHLKSEIEQTDKKIDEAVYKLYDLIPEEIEIIEKSNKKMNL